MECLPVCLMTVKASCFTKSFPLLPAGGVLNKALSRITDKNSYSLIFTGTLFPILNSKYKFFGVNLVFRIYIQDLCNLTVVRRVQVGFPDLVEPFHHIFSEDLS